MEIYFLFLDRLRKTGAVNMWGAMPYLAESFHLSKVEARRITGLWMQTFNETESVEDRVAQAEEFSKAEDMASAKE